MPVEQKTLEKIETANKIAIIGPSGAGKTTLAKQLYSKLRLKRFHLDRFFWQSGWIKESNESRAEILEKLVLENNCWIIEGAYINSSEIQLKEADIIIFLDISPFICLWRRIKRHLEYKEHPGRDLPKESPDKLTLLGIFKILFFPFGAKRKLKNKLRSFPEKVIQFHSTKEVEKFLLLFGIYPDEIEPSLSSIEAFLILAFILIATLTNDELAFVISLILAALGLIAMIRPTHYFSLSKKHQLPQSVSVK